MMYGPKTYLQDSLNWRGLDGTQDNGFYMMQEIGYLYGKTAHEVGKKLKELGLLTKNGRPSRKAYTESMVAPRGYKKYTWVWDLELTCDALEEGGWEEVSPGNPADYQDDEENKYEEEYENMYQDILDETYRKEQNYINISIIYTDI